MLRASLGRALGIWGFGDLGIWVVWGFRGFVVLGLCGFRGFGFWGFRFRDQMAGPRI